MNDQDAYRGAKIRELLEQELKDGEDLAAEARTMIEYLLLEKKGYAPGDIRKSVSFEVRLGQETAHSCVDFLVSLDKRNAIIIKCAAGSLTSRERQVVAAARVLDSPPVPFAVVADPVNAEVLEVATGKVIGEGFGAIPLRDQLVTLLANAESKVLSPERIEKEKRILLAFDVIKCCVPQGKDGGVKIGDSCDDAKKPG
jgi:hypothetical protein